MLSANVSPEHGRHCGTFEGSGVKTVKLPDTLKIIERDVFREFTNLRRILLPEGLEVIGERCFQGSELKKITIPSVVSTIHNNAF